MKEFEENYFLSLEQQDEPVEVEQQLSPSLAQQPEPTGQTAETAAASISEEEHRSDGEDHNGILDATKEELVNTGNVYNDGTNNHQAPIT
jgi:hypothetical protein